MTKESARLGLPEVSKTFEEHPYFSSRVNFGGRDGFFVRGPEEPHQGRVARRGALLVHLPEQPPDRQWYGRNYAVEYPPTTLGPFVEKAFAKREAEALELALCVLRDMGLAKEGG